MLDGRAATESDSPFKELQIDTGSIPSRHPADRFLSLLARLETYRYSLLLWTNVSSPEVMLIETLDRIPPNVAIVLTSPYKIQMRWPGSIATDGNAAGREEPAPTCFIDQVTREDYRGALAAVDGAALKTAEEFACLYLAAIKRGRLDLAQKAIAGVRPINAAGGRSTPKQSRWPRREAPPGARRLPVRARARARRSCASRKSARAAGTRLCRERNGRSRAGGPDVQNAIATLEGIEPKQGDSRWHSALARALRDYADMLADQEASKPCRCCAARRRFMRLSGESRKSRIVFCPEAS